MRQLIQNMFGRRTTSSRPPAEIKVMIALESRA